MGWVKPKLTGKSQDSALARDVREISRQVKWANGKVRKKHK